LAGTLLHPQTVGAVKPQILATLVGPPNFAQIRFAGVGELLSINPD
jgi:hypothetical protein